MKRQASSANKTMDFNRSEVNDDGKSMNQTNVKDQLSVSTGPNLDEKDYSCEKKFYTHQFDN